MRRRLNKWYRLAIVLTLLWLIAAPLVLASRQHVSCSGVEEGMRDGRIESTEAVQVEKLADGEMRCQDSWKKRIQAYYGAAVSGRYFWRSAFLAGLGWVLVLIAVYTTRWILGARKPPDANL